MVPIFGAHWGMAAVDDDITSTFDPSEVLDQLESDRSLVHRGVDDPLDEGIIAPDDWSPTMHETLSGRNDIAARLRQEDRSPDRYEEPDWDGQGDDERDYRRAGRLVDANAGFDGEDNEASLIGHDRGISGGAASAEEAAVQIRDEDELDEMMSRDD